MLHRTAWIKSKSLRSIIIETKSMMELTISSANTLG